MDKNKIDLVVNKFFNSLKSSEDKQLETGLSQHTTLDLLKEACMMAINDNPEKFEIYCKWFLNGSMYLLDEDEELLDIDEQLRLAR